MTRGRHSFDHTTTLDDFNLQRSESPTKARGCYTSCTHFRGIFYAERLLCDRGGGGK